MRNLGAQSGEALAAVLILIKIETIRRDVTLMVIVTKGEIAVVKKVQVGMIGQVATKIVGKPKGEAKTDMTITTKEERTQVPIERLFLLTQKRMTEIAPQNLIEDKMTEGMMRKNRIREDMKTAIETVIARETLKKTLLIAIEIEIGIVLRGKKNQLLKIKEEMIGVEEKEVVRAKETKNKKIKTGDKIKERKETLMIGEKEINLLKRRPLMIESATESPILIVTERMINQRLRLLNKLQNLKISAMS